ncbi:MAG: NusG domain II-containing protein [Lachnospiraceae bacterium]|nr:NusG domain II-containing protein [Lachnospiraceae bacterium]
MKSDKEKLISKGDIILLAVVIVVCVTIAVLHIVKRDKGLRAEISVDGEVVKSIELQDNTEYEVVTDMGTNLIVVKDGKLTVETADCPDKVCVNHKPISLTGETIICLPHKLVIEVVN